MSKITIIEGNSNDKDQVRNFMVKGEKGDKGDKGEDAISPLVSVSKEDGVTTITILDAEGTHIATINDGQDGEMQMKIPCCNGTSTGTISLTANTWSIVPIASLNQSVSNYFSITNDGGIVCPDNGVILVTGTLFFQVQHGTGITGIFKNNTLVGSMTSAVPNYEEGQVPMGYIQASNVYVPVVSGDIIYLKAQSTETGDFISTTSTTNLTMFYIYKN